MGSQRIVSKIGDLESFGADPRRVVYAGHDVDGIDEVDFAGKYQTATSTIKERYEDFDLEYKGEENNDYVNGQGFCCTDKKAEIEQYETSESKDGATPERLIYFYHSDHFGSSSLITNFDGEVTQHVEYIPYGEVFLEERNNTWNTPYLFNAKELDEETGLYYYGARYLNPMDAMWLSVDPLFEKYVGMSPYNYCAGNPVKLIDPDGRFPKSILTFNPNLGLHGGYKYTKSATHLLSLVSGVNKTYIENAVVQKRAPGQYRPWYSSNSGGGAMVLASSSYNATITFTQNWFDDDASSYNGHGFGQNVMAWLFLSSHEVGHIPQINQKGGLLGYLTSFGLEYAQHGHDNAPSEIEADKGYQTLKSFNSFVNDTYGKNSIKNLFESDDSEAQKIKTIDKWWEAFQDFKKQQEDKSIYEF